MPSATASVAVKLEVLQTAELPIPVGYVFPAEGGVLTRLRAGLTFRRGVLDSLCLAYVVRHPTAGVSLIDTGMHPDASRDLRQDFGLTMSLLFRGIKPSARSFDDQLRDRGIDPESVDRVVMTHLHVDHTSGMRLLPNATFICDQKEWAAARGRLAARNGYVAHHLPPESRMQLVDFNRGKRYLSLTRTIDLLGDGSIRLVSTPGHTHGHQSVLLALEAHQKVLVVGDAAYTLRSIRDELLPMIRADVSASRQTLKELNAFSEEQPDAILVPTHDPDAWRQLSAFGQPTV